MNFSFCFHNLLFDFGKILCKIPARDIIEESEFREHRPGQAVLF